LWQEDYHDGKGVLKVNFTRWIAPVAICHLLMICGLVSSSHGQTKVALIDIGSIFKNHQNFSAQLADLKIRAEQLKGEAQQIQQKLIERAEILNGSYAKESPEYRDGEAELAKESATLEVEQRAKMRELLQEEARVHFDTYVEISRQVSQICDEFGIQLVLRFNSEEMDPKNPRTIMQRVNGGVVFYSPSADITNQVIARIAQGSRQAANAGGVTK
jgi:Skp family chaperone for outer membrane proteins